MRGSFRRTRPPTAKRRMTSDSSEDFDQVPRQRGAPHLDDGVHHPFSHPPVLVAQEREELRRQLAALVPHLPRDLGRDPAHVGVPGAQEPDDRPRGVDLARERELGDDLGCLGPDGDVPVRQRLDQMRRDLLVSDLEERVEDQEARRVRPRLEALRQVLDRPIRPEALEPVDDRPHDDGALRLEARTQRAKEVRLLPRPGQSHDRLRRDALVTVLQRRSEDPGGGGEILRHEARVGEIAQGVHALQRLPRLEDERQERDRMVTRLGDEHVHGVDLPEELGVCAEVPQTLERALPRDLLQDRRARLAHGLIRRAEHLTELGVHRHLVQLRQERRDHPERDRLRPGAERLHQRAEDLRIGGELREERERGAPAGVTARPDAAMVRSRTIVRSFPRSAAGSLPVSWTNAWSSSGDPQAPARKTF